jgi:hypothetical protein
VFCPSDLEILLEVFLKDEDFLSSTRIKPILVPTLKTLNSGYRSSNPLPLPHFTTSVNMHGLILNIHFYLVFTA